MTYIPTSAPQPDRKPVIRAISGALGFGLITLLTNLGVSYLFSYLYATRLRTAPEIAQVCADIGSYLLLISPGALFLFLFFRKAPNPDVSGKPLVPALPFLFVPMAIGAGYLTSILTDEWFGAFFSRFSNSTDADSFYVEPLPVFLYFIAIVVLPAFFEEWIYRGLLLKNLLPIGKTAAVILSSGIFALSHPSLSQSFFAFAVGIPLGIAYAETGSIRFSVIIHALTNLLSFAVGYWGVVWPQDWIGPVYNLIVILLIHAFIAGVFVYSLMRRIRLRKAFLEGRPADVLPARSNVRWIFANPLLYLWIAVYVGLLVIYYVR